MPEPVLNNVGQETVAPVNKKSSEWEAFKKNTLGMIALWILIIICLIALLAPLLMPHDPLAQNVVNRMAGPSGENWLGTDPNGRDIFSRILLGSQISLIVGFAAVAISSIVGFAIGMIAGYKGGKVDDIIMRFMEAIMSIPLLLLGLMVLVAVSSNMITLILIISIGLMPSCARIARGSTLELKEKEFIKAAISMGAGSTRILLTHILPNIIGPLLVISTLNMTVVIMVEAALSFLGMGIQPPTPTWGNMIQDGFRYITTQPGVAIYPGIALMIVSVCFNLVGDALRDAVDPHIKQKRK
ncbi:ABC transporter permease [Alkalihalobacterium alkalinitrilicum]|uniref:ABC transporter permease n=1 Tax=Alkalihalobacterium alkalinitrilicum TaxID=427920 RepID=UPI000995C5F7|nr:ABC transporter permease [Alkalihalobacterium alkalinitrilicum]